LTSEFLQIILNTADFINSPAVVIGGLALPAYNVARTTLDIDICIYIKSQEELEQFIEVLRQNGISTSQTPKINQELFTVFGEQGEAEIWLMPCDAFHWDEQMVKSIRNFFGNVYVLAVEDYILTKLARSDRNPTDIDDILKILIMNKDKLDWDYFRFRLRWADLESDFKEILKGFTFDFNEDLRNLSKEILNKFFSNKK
jgi:hypothetical protein